MKNVYREMQAYKDAINNRIRKLTPYTLVYPGKNIKITKDRDRVVYRIYDSFDKTTRYLSGKNTKMITELCNKRYAENAIRTLEQNLKAADKFLNAYSGMEEYRLSESSNAIFRAFNRDIALDYAAERERWAAMEYVRNPYYEEHLIHPSVRGELYRSKSECLIADSLLECGLAYIPEHPLKLRNGNTIYIDFKILVPESFEIVYWEHFGLMDNPEYASKNSKRIVQLNDSGIITGKNLIITMETRDCPLSKPYVMSVIENQILK